MSDVNLKISNELIKGIVERKVHAEVAAALAGSHEQIISELVKNSLGVQLDYEGKPTRYSSDARFNNLIEYQIHKAMKEISGSIVQDWIEKSKEKLQKQIEASLSKQAKSISSEIMNNFINGSVSRMKYDLVVTTDSNDLQSKIRNMENKLNTITGGK
jgi:predicted RNase H-related nuclease YkuK (DUF458 family)